MVVSEGSLLSTEVSTSLDLGCSQFCSYWGGRGTTDLHRVKPSVLSVLFGDVGK